MANINPPEFFIPMLANIYPPGSPDTMSSYSSPETSPSPERMEIDEQPSFNIFQALLRNPEAFYEFTRHLDPEEFVILYSICRPFFVLVNNNFTTCMERNAQTTAPESAAIFPFNCYRSLCQYDPLLTRNEAMEKRTTYQARDVPSFRWLRFIRFRENTVDSIMLHMAEAGHLLPSNASLTLKKIWFLMDFPDNARRIGTIHNEGLWTNDDLLLATMFFIKLDMRCTDPMDGGNRPVIRRLLMAQPTLSAVDMVLQRKQMRDMYDFFQMYVEWRVVAGFPQTDLTSPHFDWTVFGMPLTSAGSLQFEGRVGDPDSAKLLRPDELVMKEGIRRELRMNRWYLDLMLWGHVDEETGENIWPPSAQKRMAEKEQKKENERDGSSSMVY
jgi:hypothetical protein